MKYDTIIRGGLLVLEDETAEKDLAICHGKIAAILERDGCDAHEADEEIDATGCYIFPGAIDTHTHFFEPGADYREDFAYGTRAAASGGFTCIMEMPNSAPAVTDKAKFDLKKKLASKSVVDYCLWAGATADNQDKIDELIEAGCIAFKAFTLDAGPTFLYLNTQKEMETMKILSDTGYVFGFHAEDPIIISELRKKYENDEWTVRMNDMARPYYAELNAINQILLFAKETGCKVHICHLSIPEGAAIIAEARKNGVDVTVESCSHYFLLNLDNAEKYDTYALIQPPIRSRERMEKMWDYLLDGTIDYLGTDHAPYLECDKEPVDGNKWNVIGGAPSIDVAFELMFDEAVHKHGMKVTEYAKVSSTNAAKRFGIYPKKGTIKEGSDADLAIIDPLNVWTIDRAQSFSKSKNTKFPYQGRTVQGKVVRTLVRGKTVFDNGTIKQEEGYGRLVVHENR